MKKAVERGMARRDPNQIYTHLSIDEKSVHKHHEYASILYDETDGHVIDVVQDRTDESVSLLFGKLSDVQRESVQTIAMDMWDPFIKGARLYLPQAKVCHDHYHLITYLNKAVDEVRRREVKTKTELKNTRYLFLKDKAKLNDRQHLEFKAIKDANYEVARAWQIKENFRDISFKQDRLYSWYLFSFWYWDAEASKIPEIVKVAKMFWDHQVGIVNAIETGANNARAERMNGSIQELKTRGRGYRTTEHFRIAILFFHGHLDLYEH